ncbi:MAG: histidine--tRNA ligase, partial [Candidatus Woesearchaeota archaeon]
MAEKFKRVRGTNDFYPLDKAKFNFVAERLKETVRRYGYQEVTVPSLESFRLLAAKSGEEIKQQMFTLTPKSVIKQPEEVEKEELALIPEFTPGMARMFVAKQKELVKPVKWFTFDKLWRYEAPQKGREREFYQLSVECYGSSFPEADAEVINLCIDSLKSFGLSSKDFVVKVNNRKLLSGILSDILPKAKDQKSEVIRLIDKSRKIPEETFDRLLAEQGLDAVKRERIKALVSLRGEPKKVLAKLKMTSLNAEAKEGFVELSKIISLVQDKSVELDLSVARGLAYYTGTVFEVYDKAETLRAIAGGGRYDGLVELFGGEPTPAVGFGMGYSTLSLLLDAK